MDWQVKFWFAHRVLSRNILFSKKERVYPGQPPRAPAWQGRRLETQVFPGQNKHKSPVNMFNHLAHLLFQSSSKFSLPKLKLSSSSSLIFLFLFLFKFLLSGVSYQIVTDHHHDDDWRRVQCHCRPRLHEFAEDFRTRPNFTSFVRWVLPKLPSPLEGSNSQ